MSESPLRSRLSKRTLLISAGAVLGIAALIFGTAVAVGLTVPGVRAHFESLIIAVLLVPSTGTLIALAFTLRRRGHRLSAIGFPRPTARLFHLLWQAPASVIVVLGAQLLVFAVTGSEPVSDSSTDSIAGSVGPIAAISMFAAVGIITPLWEELFFRGVIYGPPLAEGGSSDQHSRLRAVPRCADPSALHACAGSLPRAAADIPPQSVGTAGSAPGINSMASVVLLQVAFN